MQDYSNIALSVSNAIRTGIQGDHKAGLGDRELQVLEHITREQSWEVRFYGRWHEPKILRFALHTAQVYTKAN